MLRTWLPFVLGLLVAGALFMAPAITDEGEDAPGANMPDAMPDEAEMMRLWQEYATPGVHHAELAWYEGRWTVESTMLMPGMPEQTSTGTAEFEWLLAGRWMAQEFHGSMMGMPYEGFGVMGWDNFKKKWVMSWVDSMSTTMSFGEGVVCDPTGKSVVLYGDMDEWATGEHDKVVKWVFTRVNDDAFTFEIWDMAIGPEGAPVMRLAYQRQADDDEAAAASGAPSSHGWSEPADGPSDD